MKKITLSLFVLAVGLAACRNRSAAGGLLTLDVEAAIDNPQPFDLADISDNLEFIPLDDSSPEGLIGMIQKVAESKNRFYIVDDANKPIKVFDKTGKFVLLVGLAGRGPNEYIDLSDIAVDYEKENIYAVDSRGGLIVTRILAYDSTGSIFARNDSIISPLLSWHGDRLVLLRNFFDRSTAPGDTVTLIEAFSPDLHRKEEIRAPHKGFAILRMGLQGGAFVARSLPSVFSGNGHSILIKEARCDTVFRYVNGTVLKAAYRLDIGKYFPPAEQFNVLQPGGRSIADVKNGEKPFDQYIWVENIYEGENHLIFGTNKDFLIFDRNTPSEGFSATDPDGQSGLFFNGIRFEPMYIRDNRLVGYMNAIDIADHRDKITNPDLKALAATIIKEDGNPLIVVVDLKK